MRRPRWGTYCPPGKIRHACPLGRPKRIKSGSNPHPFASVRWSWPKLSAWNTENSWGVHLSRRWLSFWNKIYSSCYSMWSTMHPPLILYKNCYIYCELLLALHLLMQFLVGLSKAICVCVGSLLFCLAGFGGFNTRRNCSTKWPTRTEEITEQQHRLCSSQQMLSFFLTEDWTNNTRIWSYTFAHSNMKVWSTSFGSLNMRESIQRLTHTWKKSRECNSSGCKRKQVGMP